MQRAIDQRREEMAQIDAVIRMFTPDCNPDMIPPIRPGSHGLFLSYGQLPRLCLSILREAKQPVRLEMIVGRVVEAKALVLDSHVRRRVTDSTRGTLARLERRGLVRRIVEAPDTWWELV